ncbi:MAG: hypothetical protein C0418_02190 [Coriobacteriaceae bacterium]|nr:hypothetical protein [Coriobacteriaceae bacterium]
MEVCAWAETCPFFSDEKEYSPELYHVMRERYCFGDSSTCARKRAALCVSRENVPKTMLPADEDELRRLCEEAGCEPPAMA